MIKLISFAAALFLFAGCSVIDAAPEAETPENNEVKIEAKTHQGISVENSSTIDWVSKGAVL
ncbi:MAG: hypothetical protein WD335_01030 [Candidatus Paceibacterota bacterium]